MVSQECNRSFKPIDTWQCAFCCVVHDDVEDDNDEDARKCVISVTQKLEQRRFKKALTLAVQMSSEVQSSSLMTSRNPLNCRYLLKLN